MESIIATQLRLEWEVDEFKRDKSNVDARLRVMESESTRLREECVARDSRIAELVTLVESLLARDTASPPKFSAADVPEPETAEPWTRSAPAERRQKDSGASSRVQPGRGNRCWH